MRFVNVTLVICIAVCSLVCQCVRGDSLDTTDFTTEAQASRQRAGQSFIEPPDGYSLSFSPNGSLRGFVEMSDGRIWVPAYAESGSGRALFALSDAGWELISTPDWLGSPLIVCQDTLGQTWLYWRNQEEQSFFGVIDDQGNIVKAWEAGSAWWGDCCSETSDNRLVFIGSGEVTAVDCATSEVTRYAFDCGEALALAPDNTIWSWLATQGGLGFWDWSECHEFPNLYFWRGDSMLNRSLAFDENGGAWVGCSINLVWYVGFLYYHPPGAPLPSPGSTVDWIWGDQLRAEIGYCSQLEVEGVFWSSCGNMNVGSNCGLIRASYAPGQEVERYFPVEYVYDFMIDRKGRKLGVLRTPIEGDLRLWIIDDGGMPQSHVSLELSEESEEVVASFANVGKRRRLWYVIAAQAGSELLYWPGWGTDPVWGSINVGAGETKTVSICDRDELPFASGQPVRLYAVISLSSNLQAVIGRPGEEISTLCIDELRSDTDESRLPISLAEPVLGPAR